MGMFVKEIGLPTKEGELEASAKDRLILKDGKVSTLGIEAPTTFNSFAIRNYLVSPGIALLRRSVVQRVGGFDQIVAPCDDWDMYTRISREGHFIFVN